HMTGPSRTSEGLLLAVRKALRSAGLAADDIGCISAHGTGTVYNDAMEMRAFRAVFAGAPVPVYSVKGGIGHTMGAAGLVEIIIALRTLRERVAPATVNLRHPDADALGWASGSSQKLDARGAALITNAGFSGINTAVIMQAGP
ncbi:MAG TPA: beta-ketoacyl-[acyl-carrier-protein] synthase family protein, partial [Nitrospirota bacterium]|nr:beta-ketoacyl-[acyl-carrier-protein] synthase family protein [Nitrospirota bacterium]